MEPEARKFLETELEKFFFGDGSTVPDEFVAPE
jgi:Fe-S cluster biosynthesis and repair protein YggX